MSAIVSSKLDYLNKNPAATCSFGEIQHELGHIKKRERLSSVVALGSAVCLMLTIAAVISGGVFLIGALAALAALSGGYAYLCREAESSLLTKQVTWMNGERSIPLEKDELIPKQTDFSKFGLNWLKSLAQ